MNAVRRSSRIARAASLLSLGALAVHELRYLFAYGHGAGEALARQGHGYTSELGGALVVLALAAVLATVGAEALAPAARPAGEPPGAAFARTAAHFAAALATIFCIQELTEGALAAGHPAGLAAVIAHGGWLFLPAAPAVGAVCALVCLALRGVDRALARITRKSRRAPERAPEPAGPRSAVQRRPLASLSLGFGFARRPPPLRTAC